MKRVTRVLFIIICLFIFNLFSQGLDVNGEEVATEKVYTLVANGDTMYIKILPNYKAQVGANGTYEEEILEVYSDTGKGTELRYADGCKMFVILNDTTMTFSVCGMEEGTDPDPDPKPQPPTTDIIGKVFTYKDFKIEIHSPQHYSATYKDLPVASYYLYTLENNTLTLYNKDKTVTLFAVEINTTDYTFALDLKEYVDTGFEPMDKALNIIITIIVAILGCSAFYGVVRLFLRKGIKLSQDKVNELVRRNKITEETAQKHIENSNKILDIALAKINEMEQNNFNLSSQIQEFINEKKEESKKIRIALGELNEKQTDIG